MSKLYYQIESLYEFAESETKRVGTGILEVDKLIGGPAPGEVCMIIGRSYAGKSLIGQNIIHYNRNVPSIFFSLEMPAMQAVIRLYCMWSGASAVEVQHLIEEGNPPDDIWELANAFKHHEIVDTPGITLEEMSSDLYSYEERHGMRPEFVVVDYLELLGGAKASGEGFLATEMQATRLKDWAKEENMRVFVLHQTNRQERQWMPPTEDSARNAGFTEADFVVGLWRPSADPEIQNNIIERLRLKNVLRCNVLKNRPFFMLASQIDIHLKENLEVWRQEKIETVDTESASSSVTEQSTPNPY